MPSGISSRPRRWRGCSPPFPMRSRALSRSPTPATSRSAISRYEYPDEPVPPGKTAQQHLEDLTWKGAQQALSQGQVSRRSSQRGQDAARRGARAHRQARLRALLPDRPRRRRLRAQPGEADSLPGTRLGGQQRGLLLPRHHRGQPERKQAAVRPLHLGEPQRAARHRRRFRARAARGGDPVHLSNATAATAPPSAPPSSITARAAPSARSARRWG